MGDVGKGAGVNKHRSSLEESHDSNVIKKKKQGVFAARLDWDNSRTYTFSQGEFACDV